MSECGASSVSEMFYPYFKHTTRAKTEEGVWLFQERGRPIVNHLFASRANLASGVRNNGAQTIMFADL